MPFTKQQTDRQKVISSDKETAKICELVMMMMMIMYLQRSPSICYCSMLGVLIRAVSFEALLPMGAT